MGFYGTFLSSVYLLVGLLSFPSSTWGSMIVIIGSEEQYKTMLLIVFLNHPV